NDLNWSIAPGAILYMGDDVTVSLQANVSGESKDEDTFQGALGTDTAIKSIYVGPQVNVTWRSKLSAELGVDLPLRLQNSGFQAVPDYRLRFALNWRF
ncbi:MAG TPA: hypothetical protein VK968_07000, partial [Roseimicrobium sp.]|nr:hypothetical protein [Roseimicrobium sp.]